MSYTLSKKKAFINNIERNTHIVNAFAGPSGVGSKL